MDGRLPRHKVHFFLNNSTESLICWSPFIFLEPTRKKMFKEFLDFKESVFSILSKTLDKKVDVTKVSILRVE